MRCKKANSGRPRHIRFIAMLVMMLMYHVVMSLPAATAGEFDSAVDANDPVDPTEFFTGSQYRPKLEIIKPENGQVLNDGILDIEIVISGYDLPSHFDESSTCIALSKDKGIAVVEHCFDQSPELIFHVNGLTPGESYSLRVLFLERGKVIALSVRSFKVGGVMGVLADNENHPVSIQTALQVALQHQVNGMHIQAEKIYQSILSESPSNADALNRLGVNFYQQGDHMMAIAYIQQALVSNHSVLADSYYNLGEVYRVIGQIEKAKEHFEMSLSMNMNHTSAMYKLGLIYQQNLRQFELAKALYRRLLKLEFNSEHGSSLSQEELHECKVRECDLLSIIKREKGDSSDSYDILNCWKEGIALFPASGVIFNELGSNYLQRGMHEAAYQAYSSAVKLGFFLAFVNRASVLEIQGHTAEASTSFADSIAEALRCKLPHFHVRLRLATLLPRILPPSELELKEHRQAMDSHLDEILSATPSHSIENAAPIDYGFSTGYYLAFHGHSNIALKRKMYQAYVVFCPALSYGHFASGPETVRDRYPVDTPSSPMLQRNDVYSSPMGTTDGIQASGVGAVSVLDVTVGEKDTVVKEASFLYWGEEHFGGWELFSIDTYSNLPTESTSVTKSPTLSDTPFYHSRPQAVLRGIEPSRSIRHDNECTGDAKCKDYNRIRVGFVSRFFYSHPVGLMYEEVIRILSSSVSHALINVTVIVLILEAKSDSDPVLDSIQQHAHVVYRVSPDLNELVEVIRTADVDILVYTDLGLDPVTYFASFSRLAPIQATGLGHPDTSGISTIDYYLSDDVELPHAATALYSETLVPMSGMGTCFVDRLREYATALQSPRTALLERAKYIEKIGIPRSAHLYVVVQPLYALHSMFDECIARILMQDKLGYVVILNPGNSWHTSHHNLFFKRIKGRMADDSMKRILTFQYLQTTEFIHKSISAAHVLLDPFPGGSYHSSLHALSLGIPVITFPSQYMIGRQCLSLYKRMDYLDLVVSSPLEYATLALTLSHKPKIRQNHVNALLKQRNKLFDCSKVERDWVRFLEHALISSNDPQLKNKITQLKR